MADYTTPPTRPGTILLRGDLHETQAEGKVAATFSITPGMLIEKVAASGNFPYGGFKPHATQGAACERAVAIEAQVADLPFATFTGGTVDDVYAAGDHIRYHICEPGDELHMFLKASGTATTEGSFLQSAGNGDLEAVTTTNARLFMALEAVTPGGTRTRCRVRAI